MSLERTLLSFVPSAAAVVTGFGLGYVAGKGEGTCLLGASMVALPVAGAMIGPYVSLFSGNFDDTGLDRMFARGVGYGFGLPLVAQGVGYIAGRCT